MIISGGDVGGVNGSLGRMKMSESDSGVDEPLVVVLSGDGVWMGVSVSK